MAEDIPTAVRKICYERDNYRCRWCGRYNVAIHLHHVVYRSGGGRHVPENLISLCYEHHATAHSSKNNYQEILLAVLQEEPNVTVLQYMRWRKVGEQSNTEVPRLRTGDEPSGPVGRFLTLE